uniref:Uncharacterized protein n=1 Tax=Arundo donax TaxID=35708 RepID=A0A0A9DT87_ARUDO
MHCLGLNPQKYSPFRRFRKQLNLRRKQYWFSRRINPWKMLFVHCCRNLFHLWSNRAKRLCNMGIPLIAEEVIA